MNSIFFQIKLLIAATCFTSAICFGGSVSGGGGDTLPPNPIGSAGIANMLPELRGPIVSYFWALENVEPNSPRLRRNAVFFDGPVTVYDVIESLNIEARTDGPCLDSEGKEMDGSVFSRIPNGICISAIRLGTKLDRVNAYIQTMGLVIHEISHKFGFDEEAASKLQADVVKNLSFESLGDFTYRLQLSSAALASILDALTYIKPISDWNEICGKAKELNRQFEQFNHLMSRSLWTGVIKWKRGLLVQEDSWKVLGLAVASCGQAENPLKTKEDEVKFSKYLEAFAESEYLTITDFSRRYGSKGYITLSNQIILRVDSISAAAKEGEKLRERASIFLDEFNELQKNFIVSP